MKFQLFLVAVLEVNKAILTC